MSQGRSEKKKKKKKKKNLYKFIPLRVTPSDAKSCLLSMRALSTITYKNYAMHIITTLIQLII